MIELKQSLLLAVAFIVLSVASANEFENIIRDIDVAEFENYKVVNIDKIVDSNLDQIREALKKIDPANLGNMPLLNKGHLTKGQLHKLSTLDRTGQCHLNYEKKMMTVTLNIGWDELNFNYDYDFKLWFIQRYGKVSGSIEKISVKIVLDIDFKNYKVVFKQLKFNKVGKITIKIEGSFGDAIRTWLGNIIINLAKKQFVHKIEEEASKMFTEQVNEFNKLLPQPKPFVFRNLVRTEIDDLDSAFIRIEKL